MTTNYNSNYDGTVPFSDTSYQVALAANTEETITIPGTAINQYQALFGYNSISNIFVRNNATPTVPPGGTVGTEPYNVFRPAKLYVKGGDVLHIITPDATGYVGVSLMQLQG